jgi:hypothetical protein
MRGNIRKWVVLGAVAAASWLVPGCTNTNRDAEEQTPIETGTGGAGDTTGTGGAGDNVQQETGTQGQGVTGGSDEGELLNTDTESGGIRSPDMPEMNPQSGEERFKK